MKSPAPANHQNRSERPAFSLLEVIISLFLVGTVMVVAMEVFVSAIAGRSRNGNQARAVLLAQALIDEILDQPYVELDGTPAFGPETGETDGGTRTSYDDVDDYNAWTANPPEGKNGVNLPLSADWSRDVSVRWVSANNTETSTASDEGLKRILVTVRHKGEPAASLSVVVSRARQVLPLQVP